MYPSGDKDFYGIFVKNIYDAICRLSNGKNLKISLCVIKGRKKNLINSIYKYLKYYFTIFFTLLFKQYDLVYLHSFTYSNLPLMIIGFIRKYTLVVNIHGSDLFSKSLIARIDRYIFEKYMYKGKNIRIRLIVPSSYYKDVLIDNFSYINSKDIFVSPSGGVADSFFSHKMLDSKPDILKIGFCSRLDEGKGWSTFIKAIDILSKKHKIPYLAYIGGAGSQKEKVLKCLDEVNLNIKYLDAIPHHKLPDFFSDIDVFVFPTESKTESLGLIGLEALASSVPVIASDFAGPKSYIDNGINGFLFEKKNSESLCDMIAKFSVLSLYDLNTMRENAYNSAKKYHRDIVVRNLLDYFENII